MEEQKSSAYGKRPLWQWIAVYLVVGVVIYGLVYYFVLAKKGNGYSMNSSSNSSYASNQQPVKPTTAAGMQKFTDSSDFQYAYKIFPGNLSDNAKQAMSGFAFTTNAMPDGSTQVTLTSQNTEYTTQQYVVKTGYSLYFIEKMSGDDNPQEDTDRNLHDDTAVLVDPQGNIAQ
jgi:hypothetical protein